MVLVLVLVLVLVTVLLWNYRGSTLSRYLKQNNFKPHDLITSSQSPHTTKLTTCVQVHYCNVPPQFELEQQKHRATMQSKLVHLHEEIIAIMKNTYEVFKNDGTDVSNWS